MGEASPTPGGDEQPMPGDGDQPMPGDGDQPTPGDGDQPMPGDGADCPDCVCGDDRIQGDEQCDGTDLDGATCASLGRDGGALSCRSDCTYDTSACCDDSCAAAGEMGCDGTTVRRCDAQASGCLDWTVVEDCAASGQTCQAMGSGASCVTATGAEDCTEPFVLGEGNNVIDWTAQRRDFLTNAFPSCVDKTISPAFGLDLVLRYTAPADGTVTFSMPKVMWGRQAIVVSDAACGVVDELVCLGDISLTSLGATFSVQGGAAYYFYVLDYLPSSSLLSPLPFELTFTP